MACCNKPRIMRAWGLTWCGTCGTAVKDNDRFWTILLEGGVL